jgi:hypothetical protein
MNKLVTLVFLAVLVVLGLAGYWFVNPHQMPNFVRDNIPQLKVPSPSSPMTHFKPPQF